MAERGGVFIYALVDPVTREVRYVGKANDPEARRLSHIRDAKNRRTPVYAWIRKLLANGMVPEMVVLACSITEEWQSLEVDLIAQWRKEGRLLNVADGGDQPSQTKEQRAKAALAAVAAREAKDPQSRKRAENFRLVAIELSRLKRGLGLWGTKEERLKFWADLSIKLRVLASVEPDLFGGLIKNCMTSDQLLTFFGYERFQGEIDMAFERYIGIHFCGHSLSHAH